MGKKIIKLTESDLINIVKKVLNEQKPAQNNPYPWLKQYDGLEKTGFKKDSSGRMFAKGSDGIGYHLAKPNAQSGEGQYYGVGVNINTQGTWKFDTSSTAPFKGIKILTTQKRQTPHK
jgi:hypothetical protein